MGKRDQSDEAYVISLCDQVLGQTAERQKRFPFLIGDPGPSGRCAKLPVDAYYPSLALVVEYREEQHSGPVAHFDKPWKLTVSGVHRGEQRKIYDERRRQVLPANGIRLVEIECSALAHDSRMRLLRKPEDDRRVIQDLLEAAGVEFIPENGGGPGVRLKKARE